MHLGSTLSFTGKIFIKIYESQQKKFFRSVCKVIYMTIQRQVDPDCAEHAGQVRQAGHVANTGHSEQ